jgi:hypothetical protein
MNKPKSIGAIDKQMRRSLNSMTDLMNLMMDLMTEENTGMRRQIRAVCSSTIGAALQPLERRYGHYQRE